MASRPDREPNDDEDVADGDELEWSDRTWYRSKLGIAVIAVDFLSAAALAGVTVTVGVDLAAGSSRTVPPAVHVFGLLGALGFVFTALIDDFDATVGDVLRYNFRLPAALPLGVGVFLLSEVVLGDAATDDALVFGTVFLAGLYVNLAYKRLGALARRLLPGENVGNASAEEDDDADDGAGSGGDARSAE